MGHRQWKELRRKGLVSVLPPLATLLIRLLAVTLRYRIHVAGETRRLFEAREPVIFAFWHGRMLIMPPLYHKVCGRKRKDAWIMVSRHWDGELIARTVKPFRILSARGSSTRGGREALQELIEKARQGHTIGITPDGPSGPLYRVQPGVVRIAQLSGIPIVCLTWAARPRWVASSWDRFQIPLPFARVSVIFDEPFPVPDTESAEGLETVCLRLEERLGKVTDRTETEVEEAAEGAWLARLRAWGKRVVSLLERRIRTSFQALWSPAPPKGAARRILSALLAPLSGLYGVVVRIRRSLYRKGVLPQRRAGSPVISVGGVRVGGSGKTPFTLWMARRLSERGCRVVLLTRGYGRRKKRGTLLINRNELGRWNPLDCGDEPYLLAQRLPGVPVAVDGDRHRAARLAGGTFRPDLFLLDDGFQHLRLARSFDVVLVPAEEDLSAAACLPRGPLREPLSALRYADVVVCLSFEGGPKPNRGEPGGPWWRELPSGVPVHRARIVPSGLHRLEDGSEVDPRDLQGRRIGALCGIARPGSFWGTVGGMGLEIDRRMEFPDHHPYSDEDYRELAELATALDCVITTEKDAVKLSHYPWPPGKILYVRLDLDLEDEPGFWEKLEAVVTQASGDKAKPGGRV